MAKQTLNNGETGLNIRTKINDNFSELYTTVQSNSATWALGGSGGIVDTTFGQLTSLKVTGQLVPEQVYRISDFRLAWRNQNPLNAIPLYGPNEPLLVKALSSNSIYETVRSEQYPQDIIYYNPDVDTCITWGLSSNNNIKAFHIPQIKGWITRRIDTYRNVDLSWDWRNITNSCSLIDLNALSGWESGKSYPNKAIVYDQAGNLWYSVTSDNTQSVSVTSAFWQTVGDTLFGFMPLSAIYFPGHQLSLGPMGSIPLNINTEIQQPTFTDSLTGVGQDTFKSPSFEDFGIHYMVPFTGGSANANLSHQVFSNFVVDTLQAANNIFYFPPTSFGKFSTDITSVHRTYNNIIKSGRATNNLIDITQFVNNNITAKIDFSNNTILTRLKSFSKQIQDNNIELRNMTGNFIDAAKGMIINNLNVEIFSNNLIAGKNTLASVLRNNTINGPFSIRDNIVAGHGWGSFGSGSTFQYNALNYSGFKASANLGGGNINDNVIINTRFDHNLIDAHRIQNNQFLPLSGLLSAPTTHTIRNNSFSVGELESNKIFGNKKVEIVNNVVSGLRLANNNFKTNLQQNKIDAILINDNVLQGVEDNVFNANELIQNNTITGVLFTGNTVLSGFDNNVLKGEIINNYFAPNNNTNTFNTNFIANSTCDNFQFNTINQNISGVNWLNASPTHVRNSYNVDITQNATGAVKAIHLNASDVLTVTNPTA